MNPFQLFFASLYYKFYYYKLLIDKFGLYYDRKHFSKSDEYIARGYCLFQFRKLHRRKEQNIDFKKCHIAIPFALKIFKYFYIISFIRCFVIIFIKKATSTRQIRIWLGVEHWQSSLFFTFTLIGLSRLDKYTLVYQSSAQYKHFGL